jgi:hypothetical protein
VIGGDAIHIDGLLGNAAKEISSTDDDSDLTAECVNGGEFFGYFVDENGVDSKASACGQSFA